MKTGFWKDIGATPPWIAGTLRPARFGRNFFENIFHLSEIQLSFCQINALAFFTDIMPIAPKTESRPRGRPKAFHDKTDQNTVQALDRALGLLSTLAAHPGLTLSELAEASGQAVATVFRALVTLQSHGMVEVEEPGQIWHIGPGAFRVGSAFLRRTKVVERARAPMDQLMRDTGETANLGVEVGDEVLFLSQVVTHEAIRAFFAPGTKSPMHVSGIGKALLRALAALAVERGCGRFEWSVLDWNEPSIRFYEAMGASVLPDWRICRASGEALERLGGPG
jgi:GNAT superfamily N-acetyltransferase